jgi:hypothetical protein
VRARRAGLAGLRHAAPIAGLFAVALCFKEHAVVLLGLIVLAELLLVEEPVVRIRLERLLPVLLGLTAVLVAFWTIRTLVTGGLVGRDILPAFRGGNPATRVLTALGVVPEYLRLLLVPLSLSADYNPQQVPILDHFTTRVFDGLVVLTLMAAMVWWSWRRHPVVAFGLCWTAVSLFPVSNLLLPTGILLAERTLFLSARCSLSQASLPQCSRIPSHSRPGAREWPGQGWRSSFAWASSGVPFGSRSGVTIRRCSPRRPETPRRATKRWPPTR